MATYKISKSGEGIIPKGETTIKKDAFKRSKKLTRIVIPEGVTFIGECAFMDCSNLTSVNIPNTVVYICSEAFKGCTALTSITIPESVEHIDHWVFMDCSNLSSIIVAEGNKHYDSRDNCNAIIETKSDKLLYGCGTSSIPDTVKEIGMFAFIRCKNLTAISIPNSVKTIGADAFALCSNLTSIEMPEDIELGGKDVFLGCPCMERKAPTPVQEKKETVVFKYDGELIYSISGECSVELTAEELRLFKELNQQAKDEEANDILEHFEEKMPETLFDEIYYTILRTIKYNDAKEYIKQEGIYAFNDMSEEDYDSMTMEELIDIYLDENMFAEYEFTINSIEI